MEKKNLNIWRERIKKKKSLFGLIDLIQLDIPQVSFIYKAVNKI